MTGNREHNQHDHKVAEKVSACRTSYTFSFIPVAIKNKDVTLLPVPIRSCMFPKRMLVKM